MDWELAPPTWEGVSTLVAGFLAVGGATIVGLRQTGIMKKQVAIARRQTDIQEGLANIEGLKLKSDLFDRRFEVYDAVRRWLSFIVGEARSPRPTRADGDEGACLDRFLVAWDRSRFLFRPEVYRRLEELRKLSHALHFHQQSQRRPLNDDAAIEEHGKHAERERGILLEFASVLEDLSQVFGDELNLSIHGAVHGQLPEEEEEEEE